MADSRQNVSAGGIYDIPKVYYSESTKQLIKDLLQEASVSQQHQRYIERWVGKGGTLPHQDALSAPNQDTPGHLQSVPSAGTPRLHLQTKRSHKAIKKMGLYEPNTHYVPPPPKYGPGSKERCQELMAYGREGVISQPKLNKNGVRPTSAPPTDRFSELVGEMEERVAWLEAMEEAGAGAKYRDLIATQLALRLRDLELLDQERARELARAMRQHLPPQNT
ncbi:hypothetical protein Pmani_006300 [Petrolisthes manimaculis]|uniref:Uncharacterized protein n=1 Tax=Petrolisthes manimaculis TaxID=1843537 RepID=A0AAE1QAY0_9EUCA|nr:hypothetical protein Pmani_006300 [Petrolisthes manimaculis]